MKLSDLTGHPGNPRKISDEQLSMLKASLEEFGDLSGIVFNETSRHLVGAHQRLKVLPGDTEVCIEERFLSPSRNGTTALGYAMHDGEKFSVRIVAWDETKERLALVAANKHGGTWDLPKLADWMLDLDAKNIDLKLTGFTETEMEDLCAPKAFTEPNEKNDPTLKEPQLKACPNCGVLIEQNG